jgi:hypothetical protein
MKLNTGKLALVGSLLSAVSFALPIRPDAAIQGLFKTAAFEQAEQSALTKLGYYDSLAVLRVDRSDTEMMAACHPDGAMSKSGTNLKVTFAAVGSGKRHTVYFSTDEAAEDFERCGN